MAIQRYRYRKDNPNLDQDQLRAVSDSAATIIGQTQGQILDIDFEDTLIDDLDEAMANLGYTQIEGPGVTGNPGDAAEFVRRSGDTMDSGADITFVGGGAPKGLPATPATDDEATSKAYVDAVVISGRIWREALLVPEQLLNGASGGVLQAILIDVATNPADGDTFFIDDGSTTEMFTFRTSPTLTFEVQIGGSASATEGNLVTQINADSALWSAVATSGLDTFFSGLPADQAVIYRTAVPGGAADDRVYGVISGGQSAIQVVEFATGDQDYTIIAGTQSDLPVADPAAKRFGFGRTEANLVVVETHFVVEDNSQRTWDDDDQIWRLTGGTANEASAVLMFGADDVAKTPTTRYLYPSYVDDLAQTSAIQYRMPRSGSLKNMRVRHNTTGAAATNLTYTLRINSVGTALSVILAANGSDAADTSNSAVVSAGDLVDLEVTKAGTLAGAKPRNIIAAIEFIG